VKIAILSRYQDINNRGVESFTLELIKRLPLDWQVDLLKGNQSDSFYKIISGNYDVVMPLNGRMQSLKASVGRIFGHYKLVIGGHSGIGRDDIFNIVVARPDVFIGLTEHMAKWAKKWAWGSKVIKIPNGVDLDKFKPDGPKEKINLKGKVVLSVGALEWYKNHNLAIEAVSKLEDVSLLIVGSGSQKENLQKLGNQKLGDEKFLITQYPYEMMPNIYRSVDLFTLPSWDREAFGIVYLEAMASGIPVVAPNNSSRQEIVGDGGILVDVSDKNKYAEAIEKALSQNWGHKVRKQAERFSWEIAAKKYQQLFESLK
jgi:glycosyltransferase involved in cell wall biosynthesis